MSRASWCFQLPPSASSAAAKPMAKGNSGSFSPTVRPTTNPVPADSAAASHSGPSFSRLRFTTKTAIADRMRMLIVLS